MVMAAEAPAWTEPVVPAGVELRRLEEQDLPSLGDAYWRTYLGSPDEMTLTEATEDVLASWRGEYGPWLAAGSLGAWRGPELVGAILTVSDAPWPDVPRGPFIIDVFVVPPARRLGIARALVEAVQASLRTRIGLRVDDDAAAARALYAALGFQPCDERTCP